MTSHLLLGGGGLLLGGSLLLMGGGTSTYTLSAGTGTFSETGIADHLSFGRPPLVAQGHSFVVNGMDVIVLPGNIPITLPAAQQSPSPGAVVVLFDLDTRPIGGASVYRFFSGTLGGNIVHWRGNAYVPFPVEASGFEWSGTGQLPTPKFSLSNVNLQMLAAVIQFNDILGAVVTRWKTLDKYLDGQPESNPDAHFAPDIFLVEQKTVMNKNYIEWMLSASLDQQGREIPNRAVIRDRCSNVYRVWDPVLEVFDYSNATCPYTGTTLVKSDGTSTLLESEDKCSKGLVSGCKARYGTNAEVPFAGFPAAGQTS